MMNTRRHIITTGFTIPLVVAMLMLPGPQTVTTYAQSKGMGAQPAKVELTIKDREHGYETVGFTMPGQETIVVVRNEDTVTHGFASPLFKGIPVRMEGGVEVVAKNFRSFHVDPGKTMVLQFATASSNFDQFGAAESVRHAVWCDIHPEVKGEVYVIETRGEIGGG
jgi:hypothetical protein